MQSAFRPRCADTATVDTTMSASGTQSLKISNRADGVRCYVSHRIGPGCRWTNDVLNEGDMINIRFKIRVFDEANASVEVQTRANSQEKGHFRTPEDFSHIVARTVTERANEWFQVDANHQVGPDWFFRGVSYPPDQCNFYQLIIAVRNSADFWIDDVVITKLPPDSAAVTVHSVVDDPSLPACIVKNPRFDLGMAYWYTRNIAQAGHVVYDDTFTNAALLTPGNVLRQDIHQHVEEGGTYQLAFWGMLTGMASLDLTVTVRLRFVNRANPLSDGPCPRE